MKVFRFIILAVMGSLLWVWTAAAQYVSQPVGTAGNVNWSQMTIRATGIGAANPNQPLPAQRASAIRAAKLDAMRNLLETVKGVYLTSETTVRNAMLENDVINTRVEGLVKNYRMVEGPKYLSDGSVEVVVEMALTGDLADALLPPQLFGGGQLMTGVGQPLCPTCGQPWPAGKPVPPGVTLIQPPGGTTGMMTGAVYTGLIVNAKGLGLRPAMAPKIVDENGNEIYGSRYVSREWAVKIGIVGYEKDLNRARTNDRVTNNPMVVRAIKVTGPNKADVVLSAADAAAIHAAAANMNFLDKCKVMFLVD